MKNKLTVNQLLFLNVFCTIEQWLFIVGSIWLIVSKNWSSWWLVLTFLLVNSCTPKITLKALGLKGEQDV